jgi:hypothetical protein
VIRVIVYGLLVANLALAVLVGMQPEAATSARTAESDRSSDIPRIVLVSEHAAGQAFAVSDPVRQSASSCVQIGPLRSRNDFHQYQSAFQPVSDTILTQQTREIIERGHWVYLAPFESKEQAEEAVSQLQDSGVEDYYIIPSGDLANAVSLGIFAQEERALNRKQKVESLGLDLEVLLRRQTESELRYWMKIRLLPDTLAAIEELPGMPSPASYQPTPCASGA